MSRNPRAHLLHAAIVRHLERGANGEVALRSARRRLSYGELAAAVAEGAEIVSARFPAGARVVLAARDQLATAVAFFAALAARVTPLLADPSSADGVRNLADRYAVAGAIAEAAIRERLTVPSLAIEDAPSWGAGKTPALALPAVAPDEAAFWTFTSGTTGEPKAVVHAHRGPLAAHRAYAEGVLELSAADRTIATGGLPFVYVLGNNLFFPLFAGASAILPRDLLLPTVLAELERERATVLVSGPWSLGALVRLAKRESWTTALGALRLVLSAGEPLPARLFEEWRQRFGSPPLDNLGCTEMFNSFIANGAKDATAGSLGRVVPGFEVRVGGAAPRAGSSGALEVRGESRAIAVGGGEGGRAPAEVDGDWCETGDVVAVDADHRVRFLGRSDDRLKVRGQFVHPSDVERRLLGVDGIAECMVTGEVDERGLTTLVVRIVAADGVPADEAAASLWRFARARLKAHELPAHVEVVTELPRSARGKLVRPRAAGAVR